MKAFGLVVALALLLPAAAFGKTTPDKTYKSDGSAAVPMNSQEDFPVTIASDDSDGHMSVEVHWTNPFDDFDLYVYKKNSTGGLDQVGSSAGGPPSTDEATVITATSGATAIAIAATAATAHFTGAFRRSQARSAYRRARWPGSTAA